MAEIVIGPRTPEIEMIPIMILFPGKMKNSNWIGYVLLKLAEIGTSPKERSVIYVELLNLLIQNMIALSFPKKGEKTTLTVRAEVVVVVERRRLEIRTRIEKRIETELETRTETGTETRTETETGKNQGIGKEKGIKIEKESKID